MNSKNKMLYLIISLILPMSLQSLTVNNKANRPATIYNSTYPLCLGFGSRGNLRELIQPHQSNVLEIKTPTQVLHGRHGYTMKLECPDNKAILDHPDTSVYPHAFGRLIKVNDDTYDIVPK